MTDTKRIYWVAFKTFGTDLQLGVPAEVQKARKQKLARLEMRIEKAREARGDNHAD